MAFPSNGGATNSLADVWRRVRAQAAQVKAASASLRVSAAAGPISAWQILAYTDELRQARARFAQASGVSGLLAYARDQIGNQSLDLAAEFTAMTAAIDSVIAWVVANLPNDGTWLQTVKLNANGSHEWRTFSATATATLRTHLAALEATID